jgi:hypothetical protein
MYKLTIISDYLDKNKEMNKIVSYKKTIFFSVVAGDFKIY